MRAILASIAFTIPASAQDRAFWDATGCVLVPVTGEAWVAELRCRNELTAMVNPDVAADLRIDGLTVHLFLEQTVGKTPDSFTVTVPDGFVADPPVLVLDEATAAADAESEVAIQDALSRFAQGRTLLVIAHRLDTVMHADQIIVLDNGTVHEQGQHTELLARGGLYARLWAQGGYHDLEELAVPSC